MNPRTSTPNAETTRDSHDVFQDMFGAMAVGLLRVTSDGSLVAANPAYCQIVGYALTELSAMNLTTLIHPDDQETHSSLVRKLLDGEFPNFEIAERYAHKQGGYVSVHSSFSLTRARNGNSPDIVVVVRSDAKHGAERRQLAADNNRLFDTLYSIGDGVVTVDLDERVVFINKVAEQLTGWTQNEALGMALIDIFRIVDQATHEVRTNPVAEALRTGEIVELIQPTLLVTKEGAENLIADSVSPIYDQQRHIIGAVLVFRDITRKDRHDQELIKIQKLESVGVLAGGIAHDFNNILTIILGNVALAKLTDVDKHTLLSEAEAACFRARALTQQLLTFSNGGAPIKRVCGVSQLLREISTLTLSGSNVRGTLNIATDVWPTEMDTSQIGQVINNLLLNAKHAMPQGGTVTISAGNAAIPRDGVSMVQGRHIPAGMYVRITIEDTGCGIPAAILGRIFDPYFTTKDKGRGLGLAICHAIVQKHGGYIYGESEVNKGACFSIYLPAWQGVRRETTTAADSRLVFGSGKILVMDDEEQVRTIAERLLTYFGYQVSLAKDGAEALSLYQEAFRSHAPFGATILDITVPAGMGGIECMRKLREFDPEVKVIVSSGYATDPVMHDFKQYGFKDVVMKPYEVEEMSATLFRVTTELTPAVRVTL